ncbi:uncharacterized protein LOC110023346 isoform X2 [Phalaenopsis equestris]|uniref:uncharacterized protein LOC110023346 isoform X2 n=1 Tax=Phalaenopsis equestris TaxID=78828 RepID=UPI0009E1D281|nr:uncharacterized protein LOC110023346 isoform X2 [Phalaenopsis equestris]
METGVATWSFSVQIQPKRLRLVLGFSEPRNPHLFPTQSSRLGFPRRRKHLCVLAEGNRHSPWDEKPYEIFPGGGRSYLDEQDIATFVDPPKELIPLDPESYNPAAYLWKKLGDIPEERRLRLLASLKPKHIPKLWELTGTRYQDAKLAKQTASELLSVEVKSMLPECWRCRTSKGPMALSWLNDFKKVIFLGKDGGTYGRLIPSGLLPSTGSKFYGPLYFTVRQVTEIISTEQPCDLAYEFGDGLLGLSEFPEGFPMPSIGSIPGL